MYQILEIVLPAKCDLVDWETAGIINYYMVIALETAGGRAIIVLVGLGINEG